MNSCKYIYLYTFSCGAFDSPGMQLSAAVVVFAASLPHAVVWHPVGSLHTEHQVLDEGNLHTENTHQTQKGTGGFEQMQHRHLQTHTQHTYTYRHTCRYYSLILICFYTETQSHST